MRRNAAHLHAAHAGNVPCGEGQAKHFCGLPCILAVHLIKVAHLEQHDVVRVGFLDGVVFRIACCKSLLAFPFCGPCKLQFLKPRLFLWGKVSVPADQRVNPLCNLGPAYLNIGAAFLLKHDAFAVVILVAVRSLGNRVGASACAVLLFEKVCFFLFRVSSGEVFVNAALAALNTAAAIHGMVDFILGDEPVQLRDGGHLRSILPAGQKLIAQPLPQSVQLVIVEAEQRPVLFVRFIELSVFFRKRS